MILVSNVSRNKMKKTLEDEDALALYSILRESKILGVLTRYSKHIDRHGEEFDRQTELIVGTEFLISSRIHSLAFQGRLEQYMAGEESESKVGKWMIILSDEIDNG